MVAKQASPRFFFIQPKILEYFDLLSLDALKLFLLHCAGYNAGERRSRFGQKGSRQRAGLSVLRREAATRELEELALIRTEGSSNRPLTILADLWSPLEQRIEGGFGCGHDHDMLLESGGELAYLPQSLVWGDEHGVAPILKSIDDKRALAALIWLYWMDPRDNGACELHTVWAEDECGESFGTGSRSPEQPGLLEGLRLLVEDGFVEIRGQQRNGKYVLWLAHPPAQLLGDL